MWHLVLHEPLVGTRAQSSFHGLPPNASPGGAPLYWRWQSGSLGQSLPSDFQISVSSLCPRRCRNRLIAVWSTRDNPCHFLMKAIRSTKGWVPLRLPLLLHNQRVGTCTAAECAFFFFSLFLFFFFFVKGNEALIHGQAVLWRCNRSAVCCVVSLVLRPVCWKVMGFISKRAFSRQDV